MLRGSKRPSPSPEDDRSAHRPKRTKSQDDTKTTGKDGKNTKPNGKGKGKARAVVESRSPSPPADVIAEQSARLEGLIRASTDNEPTTSARAEERETEIARLSAVRRCV